MTNYRTHAHEVAKEVIVSFRFTDDRARSERLASLAAAAGTSPDGTTERGQALVQFWTDVTAAVALDTDYLNRVYDGTPEATQHRRDAAMAKAGDTLHSHIIAPAHVTVAGLLSGQPAPV